MSFGNASGAVEGVNLGILAAKGSLYVTRPTLATYANNAENLQRMADELFGMIASGKLVVDINQRYPLAEAAKAHTELSARRTTGSTVLCLELKGVCDGLIAGKPCSHRVKPVGMRPASTEQNLWG